MTFITTVKNIGHAILKINYGERSAAKSSHKGNTTNHVGLLGKHREHCAYIPTLQSCTWSETLPFGWRNKAPHPIPHIRE